MVVDIDPVIMTVVTKRQKDKKEKRQKDKKAKGQKDKMTKNTTTKKQGPKGPPCPPQELEQGGQRPLKF